LAQTSFTVDSASVAGGSECLVKVRCTDGFHTTEDISDGTFTVPRRPPEVSISAPVDGMMYVIGDSITLLGQGYDPEDGLLADDLLFWYDGDLLLGSGRLLSVGPLARGEHVISLRVSDADGNVATDARTVYVGQGANAVYLPIVLKKP
jgi:hypothetical protein